MSDSQIITLRGQEIPSHEEFRAGYHSRGGDPEVFVRVVKSMEGPHGSSPGCC